MSQAGAVYVARGGFLPGTAFYAGGIVGDPKIDSSASANRRLYSYEPRQNVRQEMADMPLITTPGVGTPVEESRCWFGLESVGDGLDALIFAYGGGTHGQSSELSKADAGTAKPQDGDSNLVTSRVDMYDPNEDAWTAGVPNSLDEPIFQFASASFWNENGRVLYVFGGVIADGTIRDTCWKGVVTGTPPTIVWTEIAKPVVSTEPVALWGHVAARIGNVIYLIGGVQDDGSGGEELSKKIFKGTITTSGGSFGDITWDANPLGIGTAGEGPDLIGYFHMGAAVVDDKVYLYGGRAGIGHSSGFPTNQRVFVFDPAETPDSDRVKVFTASGDFPVNWGQSGAIGLGLVDNDEVVATAEEEVDPEKAHFFGGRSQGGTVYAEHNILNVVRTDATTALSGDDWRSGARNPIRLVGHAGCRAGT